VPMALANSQNAPLGRAVIGGLLVATFATLMFVPCVFALLHKGSARKTPAKEGPVETKKADHPHRHRGGPGARGEGAHIGQVSGYVRNWYEDYGATVKAGQLLATIATPGLDADYAQSKARLRVAQTKYKLAVTTAARWQALAGTPAASQ